MTTDITEILQSYFTDRYNLNPPILDSLPACKLDDINFYLTAAALPTLTTEEQESLAKPITSEELILPYLEPGVVKPPGPMALGTLL